jgi:hypothetical protein
MDSEKANGTKRNGSAEFPSGKEELGFNSE